MIVEVGDYRFPDKVGFKGWVAFENHVAFETLNGQVIVIDRR